MAGVYWTGADGNVYLKSSNFSGVKKMDGTSFDLAQRANLPIVAGLTMIQDPVAGGSASPEYGATIDTPRVTGDAPTVDKDAGLRSQLKGKITGRSGEIDSAYNSLFSALDDLLRSRDADLETQYGGQLKNAADSYAEALPQIDSSYAALGSYDSTQRGDARGKAKTGFESTTKTIGDNKQKDKAALGQYGNEQRAKFSADRDAAKRAIDSSASTTDVDALRGLSNDLDATLSQTGVTRATLGTECQAAKDLSGLTQDNGRYQEAINALDSIIKSSMAGDMKDAAVQAITTSAGLSDDEKKKVQSQYGNTYAEQAAL